METGIWSRSLANSPPFLCHHLAALPSNKSSSSTPCLGNLLFLTPLESPKRGSRDYSSVDLHNQVTKEAVITERRFKCIRDSSTPYPAGCCRQVLKPIWEETGLPLPAASACQDSWEGWQDDGPELDWRTGGWGLGLAIPQLSCFHFTRSKPKPPLVWVLHSCLQKHKSILDLVNPCFRPPPRPIPCLPSLLDCDQQHLK